MLSTHHDRLLSMALVAAVIATTCVLAHAQPMSIHDSGRTVPVSQYLSFAVNENPHAQLSPLLTFPVETPVLGPGDLPAGERWFPRSDWLPQPLFVLGTDSRSRRWLEHSRDHLLSIGAFGLVVNVRDLASFRSLQQAANAVPLAPATSQSLVAGLIEQGVSVYPVLITGDGRIVQNLSKDAR